MKKVGLIVALVVVVLCGGGFLAWRTVSKTAAALQAKMKGADTTVVDRGDMLVQVIETGTLEPRKTVEVKSRVGGRVAKLLVDEGSVVRQGDLLAVIDPQETELQVKQTRAQLRGAQSATRRTDVELAQRRVTVRTNLEKARSRLKDVQKELGIQPTLTSTTIRAAETSYNTAMQALNLLTTVTQPNDRAAAQKEDVDARAAFDQAQRELDRRQGLLAKGYAAQREVESAKLERDVARTRMDNAAAKLRRLGPEQELEVKQANERVREAKANLDKATANRIQDDVKREEYRRALADVRDAEVALSDIEALEAGREQQRAAVDQYQTLLRDSERQLGETEIRAPLAGIVTKRLVQEGELVASLGSFSAGTPVVRIEDRSAMVVKLQVNEIDVAKLKVGMAAKVDVDALPGRPTSGKVSKIAPASTASGTTSAGGDAVVKYDVEVQLDSSPANLKSGMSARCTMTVVELKNVIRVPIDFVGADADGKFVMRLPKGAKPGDLKAKAERVSVKVGESSGAFIQVVEGAAVGDKLQKPKFTGPKRRGAMEGPGGGEEGGK